MTTAVGNRLLVEALGTKISTLCADPAVLTTLADLLGSLTMERSSHGTGHLVSTVRDALIRINAQTITKMPYFGVHSAVITSAEGAIAIPGSSGSGKSTATASALLAGLGYVSDEVLALDWCGDELLAHSYPRPLSLSPWSMARLGIPDQGPGRYRDGGDEIYFGPSVLTNRIEISPAPVRHVLLLGPYAERTRLYEVGRRDAAAAVLTYAFNAWRRPDDAFRLAHRIAARTTCWVLERGVPIETGVVLRSTFGTRPRY